MKSSDSKLSFSTGATYQIGEFGKLISCERISVALVEERSLERVFFYVDSSANATWPAMISDSSPLAPRRRRCAIFETFVLHFSAHRGRERERERGRMDDISGRRTRESARTKRATRRYEGRLSQGCPYFRSVSFATMR